MQHFGRAAQIFTYIVFGAAAPLVNAQFKVVGPAPFPPAVARQKIAALLQNTDGSNRKDNIQTLTGWLGWYRDIINDELVAAWHRDTRANLPEVVDALADSRIASEVIQFSWRDQRASAFTLDYAPLYGRLMIRFPESSKPFLDDLLARPMPNLSEPEAEAVCRIFLDMPDVGTWKKLALQVLPHYREATQNLLNQDVRSSDPEKSLQAKIWMNDLQLDGSSSPAAARSDTPRMRRRAVSPDYSVTERPPASNQPTPVAAADPPPTLSVRPTPAPRPAAVPPAAPAAPVASYKGPTSGTLESAGSPIAQNAEYVFRNLPAGQLKLDYDTKTWEARVAPDQGQTQRLVVRNKSSGPQKRCVVHWSLIP